MLLCTSPWPVSSASPSTTRLYTGGPLHTEAPVRPLPGLPGHQGGVGAVLQQQLHHVHVTLWRAVTRRPDIQATKSCVCDAARATTEVGIPIIGLYTDHFQLVGIFKIGVKMCQFGSKTAKKG